MSEAVLVAFVTGCFALAAAFLSSSATAKKMETKLRIHQAVTDTKLEELTREVRLHNHFAQRMPVAEEKIAGLRRDVDALLHLTDLGKER